MGIVTEAKENGQLDEVRQITLNYFELIGACFFLNVFSFKHFKKIYVLPSFFLFHSSDFYHNDPILINITGMFCYTLHRQKLFPSDKNHILRLTSYLKLFVFLLSLAAVGVFLQPRISNFLQFDGPSPCEYDRCFFEDNVLFRHYLKTSVKPFLSAKTRLSIDAFTWWQASFDIKGCLICCNLVQMVMSCVFTVYLYVSEHTE